MKKFICGLFISLIFISGCISVSIPSEDKSNDNLYQPTSPLITQKQSRTFLFSEDFLYPDSTWEKEYTDYDGSKTYYQNGMLYIKGTMWHALKRSYSDFTLDVDVFNIYGSQDLECVQVRKQFDSNNGYIFCIFNGYYGISKYIGKNTYYIVYPTTSNYLNTGINSKNHLTISCKGNILSMSVNGREIVTTTDNSFSDGYISLTNIIYSNKDYSLTAFDNLMIWSI